MTSTSHWCQGTGGGRGRPWSGHRAGQAARGPERVSALCQVLVQQGDPCPVSGSLGPLPPLALSLCTPFP